MRRAVSSADRVPPGAVVLGAGGFVGRNVCAALHAAGRPVTGVVRRTTDHPPNCRVVRLDVGRADTAELADALAAQRPALVVNAVGALWNVTSDDELTAYNVDLVGRLVQAVARLPRPVRLVHIGSAYEYGSHPGRERLSEDLPERPVSRYAQTKLAGTRIVTDAAGRGDLDAAVLRIAMSVGPHTSPYSLLGGLARQLAADPAELTLPPISGVRDIADVRDVADAVLCAADATRVPPVVNIGSGTGVRLTDVVDELIRIGGSSASIVRSPAPAERRDAGIGEQPLDIALARRELGWSPVRTLSDALSAMCDSAAPRPAARDHDHQHSGASPSTIAADGKSIHG